MQIHLISMQILHFVIFDLAYCQGPFLPVRHALPKRKSQPYDDLVRAIRRRDYVVRRQQFRREPLCDNQTAAVVAAVRSAPVIARDLALMYSGQKSYNKNGGGCGGGGKATSPTKVVNIDNSKNFEAYKKPDQLGSGSCEDSHELCCFWASLGHCDSNMLWMRPNCQKACGTCGCQSSDAQNCKVSLGNCGPAPQPQPLPAPVPFVPIVPMTKPPPLPAPLPPLPEPMTQPPPPQPPVPAPVTQPPQPVATLATPGVNVPSGACEDGHELCCFWASVGHCDSNPFWMRPNCQKACGTCGCKADDAHDCKVSLGACGGQVSVDVAPAAATPAAQASSATLAPSAAALTNVATTVAVVPQANTQGTSSSECADSNELCCFWSSLGHCDSNKYWMRPNCQKACGTCGCTFETADTCTVKLGACGEPQSLVTSAATPAPGASATSDLTKAPCTGGAPKKADSSPQTQGSCTDANELCCFWSSIGHCDTNPFWMRPNCPNACGTCGCTFESAESCQVKLGNCGPASKEQGSFPASGPHESVGGAPTPLQATAAPVTPPKSVEATTPASKNEGCTDNNELCCFWASVGHCDSNPFWMRPNCQKACGTCGCRAENAETCKVVPTECNKPAPPPAVASTAAPPNVAPPPAPTISSGSVHETPAQALSTLGIPDMFTIAPLITNPPPGPCSDAHELCCYWASEGQCDSNPFWMRPNCQISCGTCGCSALNALGCSVHVPDTCTLTASAVPHPIEATPPTVHHEETPGPPAPMHETAPPVPPVAYVPLHQEGDASTAPLLTPPSSVSLSAAPTVAPPAPPVASAAVPSPEIQFTIPPMTYQALSPQVGPPASPGQYGTLNTQNQGYNSYQSYMGLDQLSGQKSSEGPKLPKAFIQD